MRFESCVTWVAWIPGGGVTGGGRVAFDTGVARYDDPPPAELGDVEELRTADRFRFANVLRAWIDVGGSGRITGSGYSGGGPVGAPPPPPRRPAFPFPAGPPPPPPRPPPGPKGSGRVRPDPWRPHRA